MVFEIFIVYINNINMNLQGGAMVDCVEVFHVDNPEACKGCMLAFANDLLKEVRQLPRTQQIAQIMTATGLQSISGLGAACFQLEENQRMLWGDLKGQADLLPPNKNDPAFQSNGSYKVSQLPCGAGIIYGNTAVINTPGGPIGE